HAMLVVVVQQVHRARLQLVHLVGREVDDLPFALGDEDRFDVVGVPEVVVGAGLQRGLVDGEAHLLPGQDDALAAPVLGLDVILGTGDVIHGANEHVGNPLGVLRKWGWSGRETRPDRRRPLVVLSLRRMGGPGFLAAMATPAGSRTDRDPTGDDARTQARASATAWRRMSRPWESSSLVTVSGGSSLMTSSSGPEVSTSRPASKALRTAASVWSGFSNSRPRNRPRPLAERPFSGWSATMVFSADSTKAPLLMVERSSSSSDQYRRMASEAVTNAGANPRNVPLCSPGSNTSSSGRSSVRASGRP